MLSIIYIQCNYTDDNKICCKRLIYFFVKEIILASNYREMCASAYYENPCPLSNFNSIYLKNETGSDNRHSHFLSSP